MKQLVAARFGGLDALEVRDVAVPEPGASDVRIRVRAASLNPLDFKIREGKLKLALKLPLPIALGCDVAGVVDAVGSTVKAVRVGDEVYVRLEKDQMGGLSDFVVTAEHLVAKKPAKASLVEAAAVPLAALTALQALREVAKLERGQRVLIHAGAGGVGTYAIQIAKKLGAHVTTTTSGRNADLVRELGAELVVDYTKNEPLPTDFDAVFDTLGTTEIASIGATRKGGTVVGIGGLPDAAFASKHLPWFVRGPLWFLTRKRRAAAARAGVTFVYYYMRPDGTQLAELARWYDAGELRSVIHRTYPFAEAREAFAEIERGRARGKIVVEL